MSLLVTHREPRWASADESVVFLVTVRVWRDGLVEEPLRAWLEVVRSRLCGAC